MQTEAQKRAKKKYDERMAVYVGLKFNRKTDADILARLDGVENKQAYIKDLIRNSINQSK